MDYQIFTYVFAVLAMLCLLNACDYWEDYRRYYTQYANPKQAIYARTILKNAVICFVWGVLWAVLAIAFWFVPAMLN